MCVRLCAAVLIGGAAFFGSAAVGAGQERDESQSQKERDPRKIVQSPERLLDSTVPGGSLPPTMNSFSSMAYAMWNVAVTWTDETRHPGDVEIRSFFPDFYEPTWREVFDLLAEQTRTEWRWDAETEQYLFERTDRPAFFGVDVAEGWESAYEGGYIWHGAPGLDFGLDIYWFGHFEKAEEDAELASRLRAYFAEMMLQGWPNEPGVGDMEEVEIGAGEALYFEGPTPRPGATWRQWSTVVDGHVFVIVSAVPDERREEMFADVDEMMKTFEVDESVWEE